MDETREFESRMRSMDEKLDSLLNKTKLGMEITMLERQLHDLEMQNALDFKQYSDHQDSGESRPKPILKTRKSDARVDHDASYRDPRIVKHEQISAQAPASDNSALV